MKTDMICLVQARAEDAPLVQAMQQVAFAELLERYQDYDTSPATESLEKITWKISHPGSYYYFIRVGEKIVGGIRIVDTGDGSQKRISHPVSASISGTTIWKSIRVVFSTAFCP